MTSGSVTVNFEAYDPKLEVEAKELNAVMRAYGLKSTESPYVVAAFTPRASLLLYVVSAGATPDESS